MTSMDRRGFIRTSSTALGGLWVGHYVRQYPADGAAALAPVQLTAFVRIDPAGSIVVGARGCEIGQGVRTSLPMLVVEELDVPWSMVRVEQLPYALDAAPQPPGVRPRYGSQGAGGSTSIPDGWDDLRQAGAKARWMLREAAARRWSSQASVLKTGDGAVRHPDGRRASYGELAADAANIAPPDVVQLKTPSEFRLLGTRVPTVDARDIVTGRARYGIDATTEGVLIAVIERCPWFEGGISSVDDSATRRVAGVVDVVRISGHAPGEDIRHNLAAGVAVVARDTWSAILGRRALRVEWTRGPWASDSTRALQQRAAAQLQGTGTVVRQDGNFAEAAASGARTIEAQYTVPMLAHAPMEPPGCFVELGPQRARIVASVQSPGDVSRIVAELTGLPRLSIDIELPRSGGGFGRRLRSDYVAEAVKIAQQVRRPVKLIWTREDDLAHDFYRPFGMHGLSAVVDTSGRVTGWRHHVAATPRPRRDPGMREAPAWTGTCDPDAYPAGAVANYESRFSPVEFGMAPGWWRAPLHTFGAFATESFIDEVATATRRDPVALRLDLIGAAREQPYRDHGGPVFHSGRLAHVLQEAARLIAWNSPTPAGRGRGIACHFTFGGYAAHALEVSVVNGSVRIHRCICVADVGQVVNLAGLEAQLSGGTIDGLSTALRLEVTWANGRVQQRNFPDYPLMRLREAPDVEVHVVQSTRAPAGAGEMGIPSALPALTNAIHAATGKRIRTLPIGDQLRTGG